MDISIEIKTARGVATYIGDYGLFSAFVHVANPPSSNEITEINSFDADIDILLSLVESKNDFLGSVPLSHIVDCAVDDGFRTEDNSVFISKDDCSEIDERSWSVLSSKYRLAPTKFVMLK